MAQVAPPFQLAVRHYGLWRAACVALVAGAWLVFLAWSAQAAVMWPVPVAAVGVFLGGLSWATVGAALGLEPVSLRWDTQHWHLGPLATRGHEPLSGRLIVCLDLGSWMLLRFVPDGATGWRRGFWLPLQRRGHEAPWHALRSTVYCARPATLPPLAPF